MTILTAAGLTRLEPARRGIYMAAFLWLIFTLMMCKSLGAMIIMVLFLPAILFVGLRGQLIFAAVIAALVLTYPIGRSSDFIPVQQILHQAEKIDPQRAASLLYRLQNEDIVLAKASERPLFGWGAWGRSRVFDPGSGADITVSDGHWVGVLGVGGWTRYLFEFGLLCIPLILLARHTRRYGIGMETSVLALILAANLIDLIPNSGMTPVTWMIAGALWGRLELGRIDMKAGAEPVSTSKRRGPRYTRSGGPDDALPTATERPRHRFTRQDSGHKPRRSREYPQ
jgi:hypothetical protein